MAALMDMISQFLGHKGNIREMISLLNFSLFPQMFILPLTFIFAVINFAPFYMMPFFGIVLFVWSAWVAVTGISEMHSVDVSRAILIFIFPYVLITGFFVSIAFLAIFSFFSYIF